MLSTMRTSWLFFALLALVALSSAISMEEIIHLDGIEAYLHHGEKRQAQGTGSTTPAPETTPTEEPTPSDEPDDTPTPTPTPTDETTTNAPEPTPTPTPSNQDTTTTRNTESSTSDAPTSDPPETSRTPTPRTTTRAVLGTSTRPFTVTTVVTSGGSSFEITSTGTSTDTFTSALVTETSSALPQDGESSGGGGGLSDNSKKIIGGVVGGVGGAILLGGIALVCWRMWGRKNRVAEDDADLMANTGAALGDKPQNNASPFQSNLEQYHNPGGRPNAAANF